MFTLTEYGWPLQNWRTDPARANGVFPTDVASASWLKRRVVRSVLAGELPESALYTDHGEGDALGLNCNADGAFVDLETGQIVCIDNPEDLLLDGTEATGSGMATTTSDMLAPSTVAHPQVGSFVLGSLPTEMPTKRSIVHSNRK
jgi:hypothetical protein